MPQSFAPLNVSGADIGDWISPEHRTFLALNLTQSITAAQERDGFQLLDDFSNDQIAVWFRNGVWVIGCRATGVGHSDFMSDFVDDEVLAGAIQKPVCDLNITANAMKVISSLQSNHPQFPKNPRPGQVWVVGYSLGGAAAMCVGESLPWVNVVSFAGGAPATRPRYTGPGPGRAVHYHVVGDLVSTHMSPQAAKIIRVNKNLEFGVLTPHISGRFLKSDPSYGFWTADQEDEAFLAWATESSGTNLNPVNLVKNLFTEATTKIACESPIPGSRRAAQMQSCGGKCQHNV